MAPHVASGSYMRQHHGLGRWILYYDSSWCRKRWLERHKTHTVSHLRYYHTKLYNARHNILHETTLIIAHQRSVGHDTGHTTTQHWPTHDTTPVTPRWTVAHLEQTSHDLPFIHRCCCSPHVLGDNTVPILYGLHVYLLWCVHFIALSWRYGLEFVMLRNACLYKKHSSDWNLNSSTFSVWYWNVSAYST